MVRKKEAIVGNRIVCLAMAFFFLGLAAALQWSCATPPPPLLVGQLLQRELATKAFHQYALTLKAGQYARILLTPTLGHLEGKLYDPRRQQIATLSFFENEPSELSIVAFESGDFQLELHSLEENRGQEKYSLKWDELRASVAPDSSRVAAEAAFATAEKLRRAWKAEQTRQAIPHYSAAKDLWHSVSDARNVAKAHRKMGGAFLSLGELSAARENYERAYALSQAQGDWQSVARTLNDWCELDLRSDEPEKARKKAAEILAIGQSRNAPQLTALATAHLNQIEGDRDPLKTVPSYEQLIQFWAAAGEPPQQAEICQKLGIAYYHAGEFIKAIGAYEQALQLSRAMGDRYRETRALIYQGNAYSVIGEKQKALNCYEKARPLVEQLGDPIVEARFAAGLAFIYDSLGNKLQALAHRQKGQQLFHQVGARSEEATSLMYIGELNNALEKTHEALASFEESLQLFRELKKHRMESHVLRNIGRVFESQARTDQALRKYTQALQMTPPGTDEWWKGYVYVDIGRLLQRNRQYAQAALHYHQALEFNRKTEDKIGESQTYYYLAKLSLDLGRLAEAQAQIKQAAHIIESIRSKVVSQELRLSYFASVNQIFALYIDLLMQQHKQAPHGKFLEEALSVSEQSRARSLLDSLNESRHDIKQGVDAQLLEQERTLQHTLNNKADRKLNLAGNRDKEAELAAVTSEVKGLTSQLDDVRSNIRKTSPRYAALTQPQPLKAAEIQQLLDGNTMLLEFALGDERSYLWAVTREAIEAYTLPRRAKIELLVREVLQLMTAPLQQEGETAAAWQRRVLQADQQYWPRAAELSQMVLGPVAEKLGKQRLVIVGDGALQLLPFAALPVPVVSGQLSVVSKNAKDNRQPTTDNRQPLIAEHELTSLPSASSLKLLREDRVKPPPPSGWRARLRSWWGQKEELASLQTVAVLADPVFEKDDKRVLGREATAAKLPPAREVELSDADPFLPRLGATLEEAAEIKQAAGAHPFLLKHGFEVNRALLTSDELHRYGVVHFATHGFWDNTNPELSGIFLSRFDREGNRLDGTLRLSDIYNLTLPKELVVLSACETAVGTDIRGEGLIALTRGFMYAGAARVMASLWKVEDTATAEMMKIFYQHLLQEKLSPAAALRRAQIAIWQKAPAQVPYNWAAFVLQGEYR